MLRFSYYRTDAGEQWDLFGQLSGQWVGELRSVWRRIRAHTSRTHAVVNLSEVTFIDAAGEQLLEEIQSDGTDLVVAAVGHKDPIASLKANSTGTILPRRIKHLLRGRP
jgi:ABC-type transporter Mla MlaB component